MCLLDLNARRKAEQVAGETHYLELSAESQFSNIFMNAMVFPEEERTQDKATGPLKEQAAPSELCRTKQN